MRLLVAALTSLSLLACSPAPSGSASPVQVRPKHEFTSPAAKKHQRKFKDLNFDRVRKLICWNDNKKGAAAGTGFVIKEGVLVTAAHVIDQHCKDSATQLPVRVYYVDWDNDFALVAMNTGPVTDVMEYSCNGYLKDERYTAIGYAGGTRLRETRLVAKGTYTRDSDNMRISPTEVTPSVHLSNLEGNIYHGMSGGPIIDEDGIVVGINSTTNGDGSGGSRELRDTILCGTPRQNPAHRKTPPMADVSKVSGLRTE